MADKGELWENVSTEACPPSPRAEPEDTETETTVRKIARLPNLSSIEPLLKCAQAFDQKMELTRKMECRVADAQWEAKGRH